MEEQRTDRAHLHKHHSSECKHRNESANVMHYRNACVIFIKENHTLHQPRSSGNCQNTDDDGCIRGHLVEITS